MSLLRMLLGLAIMVVLILLVVRANFGSRAFRDAVPESSAPATTAPAAPGGQAEVLRRHVEQSAAEANRNRDRRLGDTGAAGRPGEER